MILYPAKVVPLPNGMGRCYTQQPGRGQAAIAELNTSARRLSGVLLTPSFAAFFAKLRTLDLRRLRFKPCEQL
jgi:hypothetical protein